MNFLYVSAHLMFELFSITSNYSCPSELSGVVPANGDQMVDCDHDTCFQIHSHIDVTDLYFSVSSMTDQGMPGEFGIIIEGEHLNCEGLIQAFVVAACGNIVIDSYVTECSITHASEKECHFLCTDTSNVDLLLLRVLQPEWSITNSSICEIASM